MIKYQQKRRHTYAFTLFYKQKKSPRADFRRAHAHLFSDKNSLLYLTTDDTADFLDLPCKYVAAAVVFFVAVVFFGRKLPQLTALPVAMGVAFFAYKALGFPSRVHTALCLLLYAGVLALYALTVFGVIRTKYLLYPLFGLPFLYHLFVEDTQKYFFAEPPVPVFEWLPEISVLCIMASLFFISVSLEKRK